MLFYLRVLRNSKDLYEIILIQALELYPDRESSLKLWYQVCWLGRVEGSCTDEQDMIRLDRSVFGIYDAPLNDRKYVSLNTFSGSGTPAVS